MAFDQSTRTRLQRFVSEARALLTAECTRQLQHEYGMNPATGEVVELSKLPPLDDTRWETARLLRDTLAHYLAISPSGGRTEALQRIVREQAFTVLNRLVALRMMEARGLLLESIARGYQSRGFQLYQRLAGASLGETGDAYRCYLMSLFDEFALDLAVLFDRFSPQGRLFPREAALLALLNLLNHPDIEALWAEDETIGWIYQYYNAQEERRQMRADSPAPRNSRELAVRNQFFTPRYVVEFLTDNTLGRLWYEMTQSRTTLTDQCRYLVRRPNEIFLQPGEEPPAQEESQKELSQEELLQQPVYIPFRALKDPRDIRMLDPACGSMHFGLYAFDLFEVIYDEAWEIAHNSDEAQKLSASFVSFVVQYPDKTAFLADVPRLIIEHNLHGIDIDPRAVQITGLSLWLRAQRTWQQQGLRPQDRPDIRRSNIVCAEPMPGEEAFLEEFIKAHLSATPEDKLLGQLVRRVFDAMKLAGEAGSLLKIEEEIAGAVAEAKQKWLADTKQGRLFADDLAPSAQKELGLDVTGITDESFWEKADERIYAALQTYAEQTEQGGYQRRLFADDTARGFAFIDLCRRRYDVVLMNPPFGEVSVNARDYISDKYVDSKSDIGMAFVASFSDKLEDHGRLGAITNRVFVANDTLETWRDNYLLGGRSGLNCLLDLGFGVLDEAKVEAAAFVVDRGTSKQSAATFVRLLDSRDKEGAASAIFSGRHTQPSGFIFSRTLDNFEALPGHVIAYQLPLTLARRIARGGSLTSVGGKARQGLATADDFRFVRLVWEIPAHAIGQRGLWCFFAKGGEYQPYWDDIHLVVNWAKDGAEIRHFADENGNIRSRPQSVQHYFNAGVTWPQRTTSDFSPRILPKGCIFSIIGQGIFCGTDSRNLGYIAGGYSRAFKLIVDAVYGSGDASSPGSMANQYRCGVLADLPPPLWYKADEVAEITRSLVVEGMAMFEIDETSRYFLGPSVILPSLTQEMSQEIRKISSRVSRLAINHAVVDSKVFDELEFDVADRNAVDTLVGPHPIGYRSDVRPEDVQAVRELWGLSESALIRAATLKNGARRQLTMKSYVAHRRYELVAHALQLDVRSVASVVAEELLREPRLAEEIASRNLSWMIGVPFGRWDIRYSTGEKPAPELPDPFAPLPVCPPGQLQNEHGLPITREDMTRLKEEGRWNYPIEIPWDGILIDDPGHPLDIEARVHQVLQIIWKDRWEAIEREACEILSVRTLRDYFRKPAGFFANHLKRYSKSRRQAPIYWPLQTPSGSYTLWLYYHRLNDQTLYTCVNDFVEKSKLREVTEQLNVLRTKTDRSKEEEKKLDPLLDFEQELKDFRDELLRVAKFWKPNLNDGVQITAAPLWKLFQHKPWQKTLKDTWEKLEKGDYDWAHLAYSIWPDRVRKKCRHDKSLAIAHGLEDLYEAPPEQPKKKRGRARG